MSTPATLIQHCRKWLLLPCFSLLAACTPPPEQQLLEGTAQTSLLPAHRDFALAAKQLSQATQAFCKSPDDAGLQAAQEHWRHSAVAWSGLQVKSFGPLMEDNLSWQIQFWPDRKNLVARKLEGLITEHADATPFTASTIADASVVVQGLSALEYLLFDEKAAQLDRYQTTPLRCQVLSAIAEHQKTLSKTLHEAWLPDHGNYLGTFAQPGPKNPVYPDRQQAIAALLESLVAGAELIKRDKLERPLGFANSRGLSQVYLLEWWRSRFSREAIIGNLNALQRLYLADELYGIDDYLRQHQHSELAEQITSTFEKTIVAAQAVEGDLFSAATDPAQKPQLLALYTEVQQLLDLLKNALPDALGITLSFNGADGD